MTDDAQLTLQEAVQTFFGGNIKKATLLAAIKRGDLKAVKVGRTYFTTTTNLRGMMACLAAQQDALQQAQGFGSIRNASNGSSATDRASSARAAALQTVEMLKNSSKPISARNIPRRLATIR